MNTIISHPNGSSLTLDAVPTFNVQPAARVTSHRIGPNAVSTDHVAEQVTPIAVRGIVTASPFDDADGPGGDERLRRAVAFFKTCIGVPVILIHGRAGNFYDCFLSRYPHSWNEIEDLKFDLEFIQVPVGEISDISIPARAPRRNVAATAADGADVGEQGTTKRDTNDKDRSILARLLDKIAG